MTDTMSSTPQPSRPQPGDKPAPQRFRLPEPSAEGAPSLADPVSRPGQGPGARRPEAPRTDGAADEERYGARRGGMSRARKLSLGAVGLVILGGVAGYIGWQLANPSITAVVTAFNPSGTSVVVTFEVDKPADKSASCTLIAEDAHGAVIGSATVPVLSGRAKNVQTYTLQTTSTANTAIVEHCSLTS